MTPNGLHFERHHSGIPEINPARHKLTVHGLVARPLSFHYDALQRYPMQSRVLFLECSGNSYRNTLTQAMDETAGGLHGLISSAEWTGVPLHYLLDEAGLMRRHNGWLQARRSGYESQRAFIPSTRRCHDRFVPKR